LKVSGSELPVDEAMKRSLLTQVLLAASVLLYYAWADRYFFALGLSPVRPFLWYLLTIFTALMVFVLTRDFSWPRPPARRVLVWSVAYLVANGLWYVGSSRGPIATQVLVTNVESAVLLAVFLMQLRNLRVASATCMAVLIVACWGAALNIIEFFRLFPLPLSVSPGRVAGFYQNPNISGNFLVLGTVIGVCRLPKFLRWWFCLLVGVAVLLTFSRASLVQWAVAVFGMAWAGWFALPRKLSLAVVGAIVIGIGVAMLVGRATALLDAVGLGTKLTAETSARITGSLFEQEDLSTQGRMALVMNSLELVREAPFMGHGLGATYEWRAGGGTHNMYLMMAVEMGAAGVILFGALLWTLWATGTATGRITAVTFGVSSMFSHNLLEYPATMLLLAIAASVSGRESRDPVRSPPGRRSDHPSISPVWRPSSATR
jgi:O-antigen ligase